MFRTFDAENDKPIGLGISAGAEVNQQRNQAAESEKAFRELKKSQYFSLFTLLMLLGLLAFLLILEFDALVVRGILPGRTIKSAVVTRKTSEPITNKQSRKAYVIYWKELDTQLEQEKSTSVTFEDWTNFKETQKIELASGYFFRKPVIIGTDKTSTTDLTFKLVGSHLVVALITYNLYNLLKIRKQISLFE